MTVIRASSNEAEAHFETSGRQTDACNPRVLLSPFVNMNPHLKFSWSTSKMYLKHVQDVDVEAHGGRSA